MNPIFSPKKNHICLTGIILLLLTMLPACDSWQMFEGIAYNASSWKKTGGPIGGLGYDIRMDPDNPDIMYVTDDGAGAFKSTNGGMNWKSINSGIVPSGAAGDNYSVFCLTIDPNNSSRIWVGSSQNSNVYRSDDGGSTWQIMKNGIVETLATWRGFSVEPGNSNTVYLAGEVWSMEWNNGVELNGLKFDMTKGVIYKSEDAGKNWTRVWFGNNLCRYIWIDPDDTERIFVSTGIFDREAANSKPTSGEPGGVGILRSTDGGQTWDTLDENNGFDSKELIIGTLYMHPEDPDILLAGTDSAPYRDYYGYGLGGVYRTEDGGDTWAEVLDVPVTSVEICESDPTIAYACDGSSFYQSIDSGKTWDMVSENWGPDGIIVGTPIDVQCDPRDCSRIFVNGYGGGNFLSTDGGQTWVSASKGYTGARMSDIKVSSDDNRLIYASGRTGIFKSTIGGSDWTGLCYGDARALERGSLALDPSDDKHLFLLSSGPDAIVESNDGGLTWQQIDTGLSSTVDLSKMISELVFSPRDSQTIFGLLTNFGCWSSFEITGCSIGDGGGLIVSRDSGKTWSQTGLTTGNAVSLAISSRATGPMYASVYKQGLYRSDNDGQTWQLVNADPLGADQPDVLRFVLAVDSSDDQRLYAGFYNGGVAVSTDGGTTWNLSSSGMNAETNITDFAVDPVNPGVIYAASSNAGVYYSIDSGRQWLALNNGLDVKAVARISLSSDGSVLYAATMGGGVFRLGTRASGTL